jgi:hypothetical protein
MKIAVDNAGELIQAEANTPLKARCPNCHGVVILRRRRRSRQPGDVTYFWRHENHNNPNCLARYKAFNHIRRKYK